MRAHFTPQAEIDLEEIGDYIALDNPRRAVSFIQEIRQHCEKIADGPLRYVARSDLGDTIRICVHGNYLIIFEPGDEGALILRVQPARNFQQLVIVFQVVSYEQTRENVEPDEIQRRLDAISEDNGVPYGRVHELFDAEKKYGLHVTRFRGYLSLSDAFKSFFLETAEKFNSEIVPHIKSPLSDITRCFSLASATHGNRSAVSSDWHGYPLQAYAGPAPQTKEFSC